MSGGVDSSVTALLLQQQGYNVIGLTAKMQETPAANSVVQNAKRVADKLGIELIVYNTSDKFNEKVVDYFVNAYKNGKTPNPCIVCNQFIKWGTLFDYATEVLNADVFATGHYADIRCVDGVYKLYPKRIKNLSYKCNFCMADFLCNRKNASDHYSAVIFTISLITETAVSIPSTLICSNGPWKP